MKHTSYPILFVLAILLAASLACNISLGGPKIPPTQTPAPTVEAIVVTPLPGDQGRQFELTITDAQLNTMIEQQLASQSNSAFENPSVHMHDGLIDVFGQVKSGPISGNVKVTMTIIVDENGKPKINIQSADFGPLPVPSSILDNFTTIINERIDQRLSQEGANVRLESIDIGDGKMTIRGQAD